MKIEFGCHNSVGASRWLGTEEFAAVSCGTVGIIEINPADHGAEDYSSTSEWLAEGFSMTCPCCYQEIEASPNAFEVMPDRHPVDFTETDLGLEYADPVRREKFYRREIRRCMRSNLQASQLEAAEQADFLTTFIQAPFVVYETPDGRFFSIPTGPARAGLVTADQGRPVEVVLGFESQMDPGSAVLRRILGTSEADIERAADHHADRALRLFSTASADLQDLVRSATDSLLSRFKSRPQLR